MAPVSAAPTSHQAHPENALLELVAGSTRGPRRDGLFALWMLVRVLRDFQLDPPLADRLHRRRVAALERRLATLTLPAPLRRAVASALASASDPAAARPAVVLAQLVAPTRESVSGEAAEILADLARRARAASPRRKD